MIADEINPIYRNMLEFGTNSPGYYGFEGWEEEVWESILKPGMEVVDIGANVGFLALIAAKMVGETGWVLAFEPDKTNYQLLEENIKLKSIKNITAFQTAIGNSKSEEGEKIKLFVSEIGDTGDHRVYQPHPLEYLRHSKFEQKFQLRDDEPRSIRQHDRQSYEVEMFSLDTFYRHWWSDDTKEHNPDIVKIDVQGYEGEVLKGMRECIEFGKDLKLFIEFDPKLLNDAGTDPYAFLYDLQQDFHVYDINMHGGTKNLDQLGPDWKSRISLGDGNEGYLHELMHPRLGRFSNLLCIKK